MNLYRSFGNLMEAWMVEGSMYSESQSLGNNDEEDSPTPSSDMRSESVDSGVETASSDTSFPATSCSVSADNGEIDAFIPEREGDGILLASKSQSPVLISSSPYLCPSRTQDGSTNVHLKLEQALQRTDLKHQRDKPEPLTVGELLRRQPQASFLPRRHTLELVRGQRSGSVGLRRPANPSSPIRPMSEMFRRPLSMSYDKQRSQELSEEDGTGLSPGLSYLEQVCQMLEEIARQQMHNQALQTEVDALREHQDTQALNTCQSDSRPAEEDSSSCQSLRHSSREAQQGKRNPYKHFRERSSSDTNIATLHLGKINSDCRGQPLSTDDLPEKAEEEHEKEESKKEESNKTIKNWKLKIGSLRREEFSLRDTKGREMQPSEKSSTRRRLSQLFRRRRKTLPV